MLVPPKNILLMMMYQFPRPHDTLADLCKRRHPNAKLIHKAQEEVNNAKQFLNLIKGIDVGSETAKKTISKGVSSKDD